MLTVLFSQQQLPKCPAERVTRNQNIIAVERRRLLPQVWTKTICLASPLSLRSCETSLGADLCHTVIIKPGHLAWSLRRA